MARKNFSQREYFMNKNILILIAPLMIAIIFAENLFGQSADASTLSVEGEVEHPLKLSLKELTRFKPVEITAKDKEGQAHIFKGARLFDVLDSAGVTLGKKLRGKNLTKYVLIKALDGYSVVFALPEIDPEFTTQTILLAYEVDGKLLAKGEGPVRIIVPNEQKQARWVREVTSIKIMFTKE